MKKLTFKNYTIPDWFSFYRIVASPVLVVIALLGYRDLFTWLLLLSFSTDAVDGFLARRLKVTSPLGSQLDSFGDQLTLAAAVVGVLVFEFDFLREEYLLIAIAFVPYIFQMILAWRKYGKATAFHTYLAKTSAILQALFVLWLLWLGPNYWLFYPMVALSVLETVEEIILIYMHPQWQSDVKGIYWALKRRKAKRKEMRNVTPGVLNPREKTASA